MKSDSAANALWAKSDAGGRPHSLVGHLLDTAAAAELLWDTYLAKTLKRQLDAVSGDRGRVLLSAWHDLGKATPVFQGQVGGPLGVSLRNRSIAAGLKFPRRMGKASTWRHGPAGAVIANAILTRGQLDGWEWTLPLPAGHHGKYGPDPIPRWRSHQREHGDADWQRVQDELAHLILAEVGISLRGWNLIDPGRGIQLALGGLIVMADWIASSDLFPGTDFAPVTMDDAHMRARAAWEQLGLTGGWEPDLLLADVTQFRTIRCPRRPGPHRRAGRAAARAHDRRGSHGRGQDRGRFGGERGTGRANGASGLVFAMPTHGTTDAMYERVTAWAAAVEEGLPVSLLHGKAMLNEGWRDASTLTGAEGVHDDEFGMADPYDAVSATPHAKPRAVAPSSWLRGRHRGLLAHVAVGTIDQVLGRPRARSMSRCVMRGWRAGFSSSTRCMPTTPIWGCSVRSCCAGVRAATFR